MATIAGSLAQTYPESDKGWTVRVEDFREFLLNRTFRTRLLLLSGAVWTDSADRLRERRQLIIGARGRRASVKSQCGSRWAQRAAQLVRQLLTESALLSLAGGALGLAMRLGFDPRRADDCASRRASRRAHRILAQASSGLPSRYRLLSCLLFGLAPALAVARSDIQSALKDPAVDPQRGGRARRFRQAMIIAEARSR